jgi:hypothetical protein
MADLIDRFLPMRQVTNRRSNSSPWFDSECHSLKRQARRLERRYRRTKLLSDRRPTTWVQFVRSMHRQYREKERSNWEAKIASHTREPKRLWATFNALLGRRRPDRPPDTPSFTADAFLASFDAKIRDIRQATAGSPPPIHPPSDCRLSTIHPVSSAELRRVILSSPPKSCELDPIPTFLLQEFVDTLLPLLTTLCNLSLQEGTLPSSQKRSILISALKGGGLDPTDPTNYDSKRYLLLKNHRKGRCYAARRLPRRE